MSLGRPDPRDVVALAFAGGDPALVEEMDEWWTTARNLADQAVDALWDAGYRIVPKEQTS